MKVFVDVAVLAGVGVLEAVGRAVSAATGAGVVATVCAAVGLGAAVTLEVNVGSGDAVSVGATEVLP